MQIAGLPRATSANVASMTLSLQDLCALQIVDIAWPENCLERIIAAVLPEPA